MHSPLSSPLLACHKFAPPSQAHSSMSSLEWRAQLRRRRSKGAWEEADAPLSSAPSCCYLAERARGIAERVANRNTGALANGGQQQQRQLWRQSGWPEDPPTVSCPRGGRAGGRVRASSTSARHLLLRAKSTGATAGQNCQCTKRVLPADSGNF